MSSSSVAEKSEYISLQCVAERVGGGHNIIRNEEEKKERVLCCREEIFYQRHCGIA